MKERPILMNGAMVRATLSDAKTQTRRAFSARIVKTMSHAAVAGEVSHFIEEGAMQPNDMGYVLDFCPYGQPGDRLWVRETFMDLQGTGVEHRDEAGKMQRYAFAADYPPGSYGDAARKDYGLKWKPSIHIPRAASRILLEIVSVRVERLQQISTEDIIAEGLSTTLREHDAELDLRDQWRKLWESTGGDWDANPWVWAIEFKRFTA